MKNVVRVNLTNGFGNNLFQYIFGRLIAHYNNADLWASLPTKCSYVKPALINIGIPLDPIKASSPYCLKVQDANANVRLFSKYKNYDFSLFGNFEDYNLYIKNIKLIKSWFPEIKNTNKKDLVFHLRLGDRIFYRNSYFPGMLVRPEAYVKAIKQLDYRKLYIVSDIKEWGPFSKEKILDMQFHTGGKGGRDIPPTIKIKDLSIAVNYLNSLYESFKVLDPEIMLNNSIYNDFKFIRSFDKILFQHSTTAWWAAVLSNASKVGVYGPWRPCKGKKNKNLSQVNLKGWFKWE